MDFFQLLQKRRMCRSYLPLEIPESHLQKLLDAARRTPSAGHAQGIRYGVVRDTANRRRLARLAGEKKFVDRGYPAWLSSAPVQLLIGVDEQAYSERYSEPDKSGCPEDWPISYEVLDAGKSLMTLYLAAEELGLSCGYLGPHALRGLQREVKWPAHWRFVGLVTVGYADQSQYRPSLSHQRGWRPYSEVICEWDAVMSDEPTQ